MHNILNNHIKDEAKALLRKDYSLAFHINEMYEMYLKKVVERGGIVKAVLYDVSREQYLSAVIKTPSLVEDYGITWWR